MKTGEEMTALELREEARTAIGQRTQAQVARELDLSPTTISHAFNHKTPSRYGGTLVTIIEAYTKYEISTEMRAFYTAEPKTDE